MLVLLDLWGEEGQTDLPLFQKKGTFKKPTLIKINIQVFPFVDSLVTRLYSILDKITKCAKKYSTIRRITLYCMMYKNSDGT